MPRKKFDDFVAPLHEADPQRAARIEQGARALLADQPARVSRCYALSPEEENALRWRAQGRVRPPTDDDPGVSPDLAADIEFGNLVAATLAGVVINHREHLGREVGPHFHAADEATQAQVRALLGMGG